jgi:uncharacterized membrane protein (DUF2068 family)
VTKGGGLAVPPKQTCEISHRPPSSCEILLVYRTKTGNFAGCAFNLEALKQYYGIVSRQTAFRKSAEMQRSRQSSKSSSFVLVLIGVFKLVKALLLIAVGIGAIKFLHKDVVSTVMHWTQVLRVDPDNRFVHGLLVRIFRVTPTQLKEVSLGTFLYAGLFATEGLGLLLRKRWAEYFTIVTTSALIPLESLELARHFTVTKLVVASVNVLIVWCLMARVRPH